MSFNRDIIEEQIGLTEGHEFFDNQVKVVSVTSVRKGGASAKGVRRSDGEDIMKVALGLSGETVSRSVIVFDHYVDKSAVFEEFWGSHVPARS